MLRHAAVGAAAFIFGSGAATVACAESSRGPRVVGEFAAGAGLVFRDAVEVSAADDPKVKGIVIHVSSMRRSLVDRLKKDMWTDPSQISVCATVVGPVSIVEPVYLGSDGEEVMSQKRNLFFKTTRVRRIYDPDSHAFIYVSYSTRLTQDMEEGNSRFRTSISVVPLHGHIDRALFAPAK